MAINRSTMVDDDGSGTTGTILNNAWLQDIYTRIDATISPGVSTFSFVDVSGAGLVLPSAVATLISIAPGSTLWYVSCQVFYPTTSNTNPAQLGFGSMPLIASGANGFYQGYGPTALRFYLPNAQALVQILDGATGVQKTNAQLSGSSFMLMGLFTATT